MELDLRGTEAAVIKGYLIDMGGVETAPGVMKGQGWQATLTVGEHRFYTWVFPRVIIAFEGDPERVEEVVRRLRLLAFRGGA